MIRYSSSYIPPALLLIALLLLPGVVWSEPSSDNDEPSSASNLPHFTADYELQRNGTRAARLTRTLSCTEESCEFHSEGKTVGLVDLLLRGRIEEWTRFRISEDGEIKPREYYYRQRARGDNDEYRRLFFSPGTGRVSSRGDEQWEKNIEGETMDELLSQLRLLQAVRDGREEMSFSVVDEQGEVDEYQFEVTGTESVLTGAGTYEAVRVERVGGSSKRKTSMWFAPELDYMPIVVRHERVGRETYTATLMEVHD